MLINIANETSKSTITNINPDDIQPNAYDLSLKAVFAIGSDQCVIMRGEETVHREGSYEIAPDGDILRLPPGEYDVLFDHKVEIAEGEAGWLHQRSSLNRNAIEINSGVYDSGFRGWVAGRLTVKNGMLITSVGTPLAQFVLSTATTTGMYAGQYQDGGNTSQEY